MSSCFLCDCSYKFLERDRYSISVPIGTGISTEGYKLMKQMPIIIGSSGTETDDQQHDNSKKQNYVSYRVKKIEFRCSINDTAASSYENRFPDYILIFKVPFREPIIDYYFYLTESFILYSEPESVLGYVTRYFNRYETRRGSSEIVKIDINKPFIVGPNDYVGVFYMLGVSMGATRYDRKVDASARVWFDMA